MKTKALTTLFPFESLTAAMALGASLTAMQAAIVVSSITGVCRYSAGGELEHTCQELSGWQGVVADYSTGDLFPESGHVKTVVSSLVVIRKITTS